MSAVGHAASSAAAGHRGPNRQKRFWIASWKSEMPSAAPKRRSATGARPTTPTTRMAGSKPEVIASAAAAPPIRRTVSPISARASAGRHESIPSHSAIAPPAEWPTSTTARKSSLAAAAATSGAPPTLLASASALIAASASMNVAGHPPPPSERSGVCWLTRLYSMSSVATRPSQRFSGVSLANSAAADGTRRSPSAIPSVDAATPSLATGTPSQQLCAGTTVSPGAVRGEWAVHAPIGFACSVRPAAGCIRHASAGAPAPLERPSARGEAGEEERGEKGSPNVPVIRWESVLCRSHSGFQKPPCK
eukprot:scaffold119191_cov24-Tisochrysis_lutea.AAC.2